MDSFMRTPKMEKKSIKVVLNFVTTMYAFPSQIRQAVPSLNYPNELEAWVRYNLQQSVTATEEDLADAKGLRTALYRMIRAYIASEPYSEEDSCLVNDWAARPRLNPAIEGTDMTWRCPGMSAALAQIAYFGVCLLDKSKDGKIRKCASEHCAYLFYDTTGNGHRRWCSMVLCGNRAKVKAFNQRNGEN